MQGIEEGVEEEKPNLLQKLRDMALEAINTVKDVLDIRSPSRVFRELGNYTGMGFVQGISDYAEKSAQAASELGEATRGGLSDAISTISDYLNGDMDAQPTIRPVLDLSDIANGMNSVNDMLYNQRLLALAGQTSFAFAANAEGGEMTITVDNEGVVRELRELRGEMAEMADRMAHLQVVLDSGTLVGETADMMDSALGQRQAFKGRGN